MPMNSIRLATTIPIGPFLAAILLATIAHMAIPGQAHGWGSSPDDLPQASSAVNQETVLSHGDPATPHLDIPRYIRDPAPSGPRFLINGDGTVTDLTTGLVWLQQVDCLTSSNWKEAHAVAQRLSHGHVCGGFSLEDHSEQGDWRVPTIRELMTLPNQKFYNPALSDGLGVDKWKEGDPFFGVTSRYFWSSTRFDEDEAWYMDLSNGVLGLSLIGEPYLVWAVRGRMQFRWRAGS